MSKMLFIRNSNKMAIVDDEDFERCSSRNWWAAKGKGSIYSCNYVKRKTIHISLASFILNKIGDMFDHKDRNPFNNQKENLRPCGAVRNAMNVLKVQNSNFTSKYKGVGLAPTGKWRARIRIFGREKQIGSFDTAEKAALAYNQEALKQYGEYAVLNII